MRRIVAFLLVVALLLPALPVWAAEPALPTPPAWMDKQDYLVFPGDGVYAPDSWAAVLERREAALSGALLPYEDRAWVEGSAGLCYEVALTRLRMADNYAAGDPEAPGAYLAAGEAFYAAQTGWGDLHPARDEAWFRLGLERYRCGLRYSADYTDDWGRALAPLLDGLAVTLNDFFDAPCLEGLSLEDRARVMEQVDAYWPVYFQQRGQVSITLDGAPVLMDTPTQAVSGRVMAPVRALAEALGADVVWDPKAYQVTMTRAGSTVTMTLGSATATVDGRAVRMDVAPYADKNRTYFPVRYAAELFGQKVEWNDTLRQVEIGEDKAGADESWALGMGALLMAAEGGDPTVFGGGARAPRALDATSPAQACRALLKEKWGIAHRQELLDAIHGPGYNPDMLDAAGRVKNLTPAQIDARTAKMDPVDKYMWPRARQLWKKWEEKGILAWDLCLTSTLAQWGYTAGYLTYGEALELIAPAQQTLRETFADWDQAYENMIDGYYWCVQENVNDLDTLDTPLGQSYLYLRHNPDTRTLFNNTMFGDAPD